MSSRFARDTATCTTSPQRSKNSRSSVAEITARGSLQAAVEVLAAAVVVVAEVVVVERARDGARRTLLS